MYQSIKQLVLSDHAALFYSSPEEQMATVVPYIQIGLSRNERCLYVTGESTVPRILKRLNEAGIDVEYELGRGSLVVETGRRAFLKDGEFIPRNILRKLEMETCRAREEGFTGLRATGEMNWTLDVPGALEKLVEYEALLDRQFPKEFLGLCQYHEGSFRGGMMAEMIYLHAKVVTMKRLVQNPWYRPARYASFSD
jgi:hypothetical protein